MGAGCIGLCRCINIIAVTAYLKSKQLLLFAFAGPQGELARVIHLPKINHTYLSEQTEQSSICSRKPYITLPVEISSVSITKPIDSLINPIR